MCVTGDQRRRLRGHVGLNTNGEKDGGKEEEKPFCPVLLVFLVFLHV